MFELKHVCDDWCFEVKIDIFSENLFLNVETDGLGENELLG